MAKAISADAVVRLWAERGAASGETVKAGVGQVTKNPAETAAENVEKWAANVAQAKAKFVESLSRVTLADWKRAMVGKGVTNMQAGYADAGNIQKFANFMRAFLPYVREGAKQAQAMPKRNLEQAIARAVWMIRYNAAFRQNGLPVAPMPRAVIPAAQ